MKATRRTFLLSSPVTITSAVRTEAREARRPDSWMPQLSENLADVNLDTLRWLKQLGCQHVPERRIITAMGSGLLGFTGHLSPGDAR